jgi:alanyl-tRNA synthetase
MAAAGVPSQLCPPYQPLCIPTLRQVLTPLGGKGGGKPSKAQGSASDTAKLNDVLELATKFAQAKLQ